MKKLKGKELEARVAELVPKIRSAKTSRERRLVFAEIARLRAAAYEWGIKPIAVDTSFLKNKNIRNF